MIQCRSILEILDDSAVGEQVATSGLIVLAGLERLNRLANLALLCPHPSEFVLSFRPASKWCSVLRLSLPVGAISHPWP